MTINMQTVISNMRALKSQGVTYSMSGSRTGSDGTADCSGAVYASLNAAGANLSLGNTDSLFTDLPKIGFTKVEAPYAYGDVFIFGTQGQSSGGAGHTGIFLDASQIIHCNSGDNGVGIGDFNTVRSYDGNPPFTVFRLAGQAQTPTEDATSKTNTKENMDNSGAIEEYSYIGNKLCIKGWHFSSIPTKSNSGDDNSGGSSGSGGSVDWNDVQSRAQFFVNVCSDLGIPKNTALALAANAYAESSLDPSALEPMEASGAQGHGYFQWSYQYNWGDVPNHMTRSYEDAKYQINFAKTNSSQWITNGYGSWAEFWKGTASPSDLTMAWLMSWERPAQPVDRWSQFTQVVNVDALVFGNNTLTALRDSSTSYGKEMLEIYDATTDKLLKSVEVTLKKRSDIKEQNPDVEGVEWSGIDTCLTFENSNPFYVQFVRVRADGARKVLNLQALFFPHSSSRTTIGHDYSTNNDFLIICTDKNGKSQYVKQILGGMSWSIEGNEVPSCSFTIPIYDADKFDGHMDCKVIVFNKVFDGIVKSITLNKDDETASIELDHKISEWDYRQIPNNYTVKNETFPSVFCQSPFLYSTDWYVNTDSQAHKEKINYAFSRQGHLEALTKAVSLTDSLWWRVGTRYDRFLEIGAFGEKKNYILSETGQTERHLKIIGSVSISKQFDNIFNVATVYGEKSDSSQVSLTLREAYLDQQQQGHDIISGFPIVILNPTANREQKNYYTNITKIASNNSLEYAILDEFSINLEQAKLIEKTISMNDVAPFEEDGKTISDEERAKQSRIAYNAAVKRLKSARRRDEITVQIGELPSDLNVLDKVYFDYHNSLELFDKCSRYCKKIYEASDDFYITKIETSFDEYLVETNTITLSKELSRNDSND
ncbi:phage tail tip lysozyme [Lactococcus lactis]|uniref:phage tail tip lysozyme n=1 Tax=Lactococcus lactis TaxID=1358 RepID=UPI0038780DA6